MSDITRLYFGRASAEKDVLRDSGRFLETYLDRVGLPDLILEHEKFLVLGPKGSGKSAAAHYVELAWKRDVGDHAVFSKIVDFDELNRTQSPLYKMDSKLVSDEVTALTDSAWKLFIALRMLESLVADPASSVASDPQVLKLLTDLRAAGLSDDDYPQVLRKVREKKHTLGVPKLASTEFRSTETENVSTVQLGDALVKLVAHARTPNRHLLSIDGLDKAIGDNPAYWRTLAALVRTADSICDDLLRANNESVFLLIMCRSDVFRRISFADAPKIAADGGIHMDWGAESSDPREVILWEYISRKAKVEVDYLLACLPPYVEVGDSRKISCLKYLLDFTRYTPRDMTLLFTALKGRADVDRPLSGKQVRAAADSFASTNLLHEILSEAAGLIPPKVVDRLPRILSALPARTFTRQNFRMAIDKAEVGDLITLDDLGEYLFLQGAIGNYRANSNYYQFYHRRDTYDYDGSGPWSLHTGLAYALNVPFAK